MKKATTEVLDRAFALAVEGKNHKEIMAATGLSHSQMERHFMAIAILGGTIKGGFLKSPESITAKAAMIARLREAGESWGLISVRFNEPESRTRKAFAEATGMDSKGLRIGKGGRYVSDDPRFYTGADRPKLGSELIKGVPLAAQVPDPEAVPERKLPEFAAKGPKRQRQSRKA